MSIFDISKVKNVSLSYLMISSKMRALNIMDKSIDALCNRKVVNELETLISSYSYRKSYYLVDIDYIKINPFIIDISIYNNDLYIKACVYEILKYTSCINETKRIINHLLIIEQSHDNYIVKKDINDFYFPFQCDLTYLFKENSLDDKDSTHHLRNNKDIYNDSNSSSQLNRDKMKLYQEKNYDKRPKRWGNFNDMGGDCTNYASQVIFSGGASMIKNQNNNWYYYGYNNRSPSWTGVNELSSFLHRKGGIGVHGEDYLKASELLVGDIIQLDLENLGKNTHTAVIYNPKGYLGSIPTISSHSFDRLNEPIFVFNYYTITPIHLYLEK